VREVWFWRDGRLTFHVLRGARYEAVARSELLPALDSALIERLMTARTSQAQAVRDLRAELRSQRSRQSG
jgi:hypothetical protein